MRGAGALTFPFEGNLVLVTPVPVLARLERLDERVPGAVEMSGGVAARRTVAASHVCTGGTAAQMHPPATCRQALLAAVTARICRANLLEMSAGNSHERCLLRQQQANAAGRGC